MGYVKKVDRSLWKNFLNANFERLLKTGLPFSYLERQELWEDFYFMDILTIFQWTRSSSLTI